MDVSLLAGILVDKFAYHLPLYRQHQRLKDAGITLSRSTLTNYTQRAIGCSIVDAQWQHILQSQVLAMDETPIKASGQMQSACWPYGEDDEICFTWSSSRGSAHIEEQGRAAQHGMRPMTGTQRTSHRSPRPNAGRIPGATSSGRTRAIQQPKRP